MVDLNAVDTATQLFKGLSDPTRLRMLGLLQKQGELCVCDIMAALDLPQSTASRHLAYLRNSGWLSAKRQNKWMYYRINDNIIDSSLQTPLLDFIDKSLPEEDMRALVEHLKTKNTESCSG